MVNIIAGFARSAFEAQENCCIFNDITELEIRVRTPTLIDFALTKAQFARLTRQGGNHGNDRFDFQ
jgi:hypothetical protein